jgi:hypothetical protein
MAKEKVKIGDIAEIETPAGLGYVQYTHDGGDMGQLVRVLPGLYPTRPDDFVELAKHKELYFIFYPLKHALRAGQTQIVSSQPVPDWARPVPRMRHPAGRASDGRTSNWRILDARASLTVPFLRQTPVVGELTPDQRKLSIHRLCPHSAMVKELARGWTPERAEELEEQDRTQAQARRASQKTANSHANQAMRHFLYFPEKANAEQAAQWFRSQGFMTETRLGADEQNWLTLVKHEAPSSQDEMERLRAEIEALVSQLHGEYDGWELAV